MAFSPVIPKWNTKTKANGTAMSASLQQCEDNDNYLLGLTTSLATDMYESDQVLQGEIDDLNEEITALSIDDQYSVFTASSTGAYSFKIATAMKTNVPTTYSTILNYEIITNYLGKITGAWGMRNHTVYVNVFQIDDLYTDVTMNKTFLYEFADRWELWGLTTSNFSGAMVIRPANNLSVSSYLHKNVWVFPGKVSSESSPSAYSEANPTGYTGRNFIDYTSSSYDNRRVSTWSAEDTDDHKTMCSIGDVPGYLQNKLVGSDWIDATEVPLSADEKNIKFALKDPDFFVKGSTVYGGTILPATTGDFNSPVHNGYYTCYYNTLNAPPVQAGNPSWFVHHMNSNAGNLYAVQIAYAYTSTIICYERTKVAGVWQDWTLRSNTGVGTGEVKVTSAGVAGYLANKLTVAPGSPLTATVSDDTLVLDFLENNVADPLIRTLDLLAENGTCELTGSCWSSEGSIEGGNWGGFEQNTTDSFYKIVPLSRGTVAKAAVYVAQVNGTDSYYGSGNYGAIRLGLFAADGTLKGQTAWTRGISAIGRLTLDLTAAEGQNLTIERNTQYWVGLIGRGLTLLSNNKSSSSANLSSLRYSVQIRTSSSGASWGAFTTNGSGFVQKNIMIAQMSATEESA